MFGIIYIVLSLLACLLYTSDAADELDGVDLGGRRIIKKKFFQAEDGIRDQPRSRGLGDVYKRQNIFCTRFNDEVDNVWYHIYSTEPAGW